MNPTTRSLYLPDTLLQSWGAGVYLFDSGAKTTTSVSGWQPTGLAFNFYEVSVIEGKGSWWVPTAPMNLAPPAWLNDAYGGVEALQASGTAIWTQAGGQQVVRPTQLVWWLSESALGASPYVSFTEAPGNVVGPFPQIEPVTPPPSDNDLGFTIEAVPNGARLRVKDAWRISLDGNVITILRR